MFGTGGMGMVRNAFRNIARVTRLPRFRRWHDQDEAHHGPPRRILARDLVSHKSRIDRLREERKREARSRVQIAVFLVLAAGAAGVLWAVLAGAL